MRTIVVPKLVLSVMKMGVQHVTFMPKSLGTPCSSIMIAHVFKTTLYKIPDVFVFQRDIRNFII